MASSNEQPSEANVSQTIDTFLAGVLRSGTILAAVVIALGGVAYLANHGNDTPHYAAFQGEPQELRSIDGIVHNALGGNSQGILMLGLILLVATPIARVIGALAAFAIRRDLMYVIISAVVLAGLMYGLLAS